LNGDTPLPYSGYESGVSPVRECPRTREDAMIEGAGDRRPEVRGGFLSAKALSETPQHPLR
jgi:hypothetical protein